MPAAPDRPKVALTGNRGQEGSWRSLALTPAKPDRDREARCVYRLDEQTPRPVEVDRRVRVTAVVVGWGMYQPRSGKPLDVTYLVCSGVSNVE